MAYAPFWIPETCTRFSVDSILDKDEHIYKEITNIAFKQQLYNDKVTRNFSNMCLLNKGISIMEKAMKGSRQINIERLNKSQKYEVWSANKVSLVSNIPKTYLWAANGMFNCLGILQLGEKGNFDKSAQGIPDDSVLIFSSSNLDECKSFISWGYTRFIRYLLSLSLSGLTGIGSKNTWWRFVPDPGSFDHIFTDEELYKKYNLTPEEINIIESVIKERKQ